MSRAKRPRRIGERFAWLPLSVLVHPAFKTLPVGYQRVLWLLASRYDTYNNGALTLTRRQAEALGLNNERHRSLGLRELEARGLIEKTRTGGIATGGRMPTQWALTWVSVHYRNGRKLSVVAAPKRTWMEWSEP